MKNRLFPILLIAFACLLPSCASFEAVDNDPDSALFGKAEAVVGKRTVAGVEIPLVFIPYAIGIGGWVQRIYTEEDIISREVEIIGAAK